MNRKKILRAELNRVSNSPLDLQQGGTGAFNKTMAMGLLGGVSINDVDKQGGPIRLKPNGTLDRKLLPKQLLNSSVSGPTTVLIYSTNTYIITDYSSDRIYNLIPINGTVSLNTTNDPGKITYTASSLVGTGGFIIDDRRIELTVITASSAIVNQPIIILPIADCVNLGPTVNFKATSFSVNTGSGTHEFSDWEIATNNQFTAGSIVNSAYNSSSELTTRSALLNSGTTYWVRVRYKSSGYIDSIWSSSFEFRTKDEYIPNTEIQLLKSFKPTFCSTSLSSNGGVMAIGDPGDNANGFNSGSASIYVKNGYSWILYVKLFPVDGVSYDLFGMSICLSEDGTTLAVGCPYKNNAIGVVYLYTNILGTWALQTKLTCSGLNQGSYFGWSLKLSNNGDILVAGAPGATHVATNALKIGTAVVFKRSQNIWQEQTRLSPSGVTISSSNFAAGQSVSIDSSGAKIAFGSSGESNINIQRSGAVYIYKHTGTEWTFEQRICPNLADNKDNGFYGSSVEFSGDGLSMAVGSSGYSFMENSSVTRSGVVFINNFVNNTWRLSSKVQASNGTFGNGYGAVVRSNYAGTCLLISAPKQNNSKTIKSGQSYILNKNLNGSWTETVRLSPSDIVSDNNFGNSLDMSKDGSTAIIADKKGNSYVFV